MANYNGLSTGRNFRKPAMKQVTFMEIQEQPEEGIREQSEYTPAVKKKKRGTDRKRMKVIVLCFVGIISLTTSAAALVVSFLQTSKTQPTNIEQTQVEKLQEQLMKIETEKNMTTQLIEVLQRELKNMEAHLNMSEEIINSLSATCQSLERNIMQNHQKINMVETRVDQKTEMVEAMIATVDASVGTANSKVNRNQQKLNLINTTLRAAIDIVNEHQQKLNFTDTTIQATWNNLQHLNSKVFDIYHPVCPSSEYRYHLQSDSCYRVVRLRKNWNDSKNYCVASRQYFATFVTTESIEWLGYMRSIDAWNIGSTNLWVGGYKFSTGWKWTGRITVPVNSSVWASDEPDSDYCMENRGSKLFYDYHCSVAQYFMCASR